MAFTLTGTGYGTPASAIQTSFFRDEIEAATDNTAAVTALGSGWGGATGGTDQRVVTAIPSGAAITRAVVADKLVGSSTSWPIWYDFGQTIGTAYFSWLCYFDDNDIVETSGSQWKAFRLAYGPSQWEDRDAPNLYYRRTYQSPNILERFTVHQSHTSNTPADLTLTETTRDTATVLPEFYAPPKTWSRIELRFKESSGIDAADGYLALRVTNIVTGATSEYITSNVAMYTSALQAASQGRRYTNFVLQNWIGNGNYTGAANVQVYTADFHFQLGTRGIVYLGDAATWVGCTKKVPQPLTTWTDTEIAGEYHPGELTTEEGNYLYVMLDNGTMHNGGVGIPVDVPEPPSPTPSNLAQASANELLTEWLKQEIAKAPSNG